MSNVFFFLDAAQRCYIFLPGNRDLIRLFGGENSHWIQSRHLSSDQRGSNKGFKSFWEYSSQVPSLGEFYHDFLLYHSNSVDFKYMIEIKICPPGDSRGRLCGFHKVLCCTVEQLRCRDQRHSSPHAKTGEQWCQFHCVFVFKFCLKGLFIYLFFFNFFPNLNRRVWTWCCLLAPPPWPDGQQACRCSSCVSCRLGKLGKLGSLCWLTVCKHCWTLPGRHCRTTGTKRWTCRRRVRSTLSRPWSGVLVWLPLSFSSLPPSLWCPSICSAPPAGRCGMLPYNSSVSPAASTATSQTHLKFNWIQPC